MVDQPAAAVYDVGTPTLPDPQPHDVAIEGTVRWRACAKHADQESGKLAMGTGDGDGDGDHISAVRPIGHDVGERRAWRIHDHGAEHLTIVCTIRPIMPEDFGALWFSGHNRSVRIEQQNASVKDRQPIRGPFQRLALHHGIVLVYVGAPCFVVERGGVLFQFSIQLAGREAHQIPVTFDHQILCDLLIGYVDDQGDYAQYDRRGNERPGDDFGS